jgi:hypothetical protein
MQRKAPAQASRLKEDVVMWAKHACAPLSGAGHHGGAKPSGSSHVLHIPNRPWTMTL